MSKKMIGFRQGDVELVKISDGVLSASTDPQKKPNAKGKIVLAEGEVTNHAHVMDKDVAQLFAPRNYPSGHSLLVVTETTVERGAFLECTYIETLDDGTMRFRQTDGVVIRFQPNDVEVHPNGVKVNRAYSPLDHDEHDRIPMSLGTYRVMVHSTMQQRRTIVGD